MSIVTWECVKCHKKFVDPDEPVYDPEDYNHSFPEESQEHWLGPTEPVCTSCAAAAGIPPVDED